MRRIQYIDFAKGILIILVVVDHVYWMINGSGASNYDELELWYNFRKWFQPWYMAAFFFLSGLVANYNKGFKTFLLKNIRTLILPSITFSLLCFSIDSIVSFNASTFMHGIINCILSLGSYWFLISLFLAKIVIFCINNLSRNMKLAICCILYVISSLCAIFLHNANPLYIMQAFSLLPFLYLGELFRSVTLSNRRVLTLFVTSCVLICIVLFLNISVAGTRAQLVNYSLMNFVPSLFYSLIITVSFVQICKVLNNRVIEYIGRNSISIYCLNVVIIKYVLIILNKFNVLTSNKLILAFILLLLVFAFALLFSRIINTRYLRWFLGK